MRKSGNRRAGAWRRALLGLAALGLSAGVAWAQPAPSELKIGHLYASSGPYASTSMPVYDGLKLWIDEMNRQGGVFVKPYGKRIPIRLIAYDDQSSTATATTLTNQLITQDKVDILVGDASSVLTSAEVPVAREHKILLFNPSGTGATLFSPDNPYLVLCGVPASIVWPRYLAEFLAQDGVKAGIHRVAILYATNDFTGPHADSLRRFIKASGAPLQIVFDQGVPTSTTAYTVAVNNIAAAKPDAVIELGFPGNDIAFLRNVQDAGQTFRMLFAIYPGLETELLKKNVGFEGLRDVFTYVTGAAIDYKPEVGLSLAQFRTVWDKAYANTGVEFGWNAVVGYTTALVVQQALATTDSMGQLDLRKAVFAQSGKLRTLDGTFALDAVGEQVGEITPIGQMVPDGHGGLALRIVYPANVADAAPVFGKG